MRPLPLLLAACLSMPHFETDGPACVDPTIACACGECIVWDPTPGAARYELERETVSTGARYQVGRVEWRAWTDDDGATHYDLPALWCAPSDSPFPRADTLYRYRIRACNEYGCGEPSEPVTYRAAPYACYQGNGEVACYTADPVVSR